MSPPEDSASPSVAALRFFAHGLCRLVNWEAAPRTRGAHRLPLAILMALALVLRALVLVFTRPSLAADSTGYQALARALTSGDFSGYDGIRTPGYPLFLAVLGNNVDAARLAQLVMGIAITAMLFFTALRLTGRPWAAFTAGALYGLNVQQVYFESIILSETLATALLVTVVWLISLTLLPPSERLLPQLIALGLASAVLALTRPAFAFVPVIALWAVLPVHRRKLTLVLAVLIPGVVMLCAWSAFNWYQIKIFSPSTITGPAMLTHSLDLIPGADPKYAHYRDTYLRLSAERGGVGPSEWLLARTLAKETQRSLPSVSEAMTPLAISLIMAHPAHYAGNVVRGAAWFWKGTGRGSMPWRTPHTPLSLVWLGEKLLFFIASGILFLATAVVSLVGYLRGNRSSSLVSRAWCSVSLLVIVSCITQALTQYGANARYGMPLQPLWSLALVVWLSLWFESSRKLACSDPKM